MDIRFPWFINNNPDDTEYKIGDSVIVNPGVTDPDDPATLISGWQAWVSNIDPKSDYIELEWDGPTLRSIPDDMIRKWIITGYDWRVMVLSKRDISHAIPRDTHNQTEEVVSEIEVRHQWDYLGDTNPGILDVIDGHEQDDVLTLLHVWEEHLQDTLLFPFQARVKQPYGHHQPDDIVEVIGIEDIDEIDGVRVNVIQSRDYELMCLSDLEVLDHSSINYQPVDDYFAWFAEMEEDHDYILETVQERVYNWGVKWSNTPGYKALTQEQQVESQFIVTSFADYMFNYFGVTPGHWNAGDMEECCLSILPEKIVARDSYFREMAPVLASFFTYLDETQTLPGAVEMADRIKSLGNRIVDEAENPYNWGMAKSFFMEAMAAGVDVTDKREMHAYLNQRNQGLTREVFRNVPTSPPVNKLNVATFVRSTPKIGRNDPCPCGSGKKYKKCCGR